jgi:hypothetical protein
MVQMRRRLRPMQYDLLLSRAITQACLIIRRLPRYSTFCMLAAWCDYVSELTVYALHILLVFGRRPTTACI